MKESFQISFSAMGERKRRYYLLCINKLLVCCFIDEQQKKNFLAVLGIGETFKEIIFRYFSEDSIMSFKSLKKFNQIEIFNHIAKLFASNDKSFTKQLVNIYINISLIKGVFNFMKN